MKGSSYGATTGKSSSYGATTRKKAVATEPLLEKKQQLRSHHRKKGSSYGATTGKKTAATEPLEVCQEHGLLFANLRSAEWNGLAAHCNKSNIIIPEIVLVKVVAPLILITRNVGVDRQGPLHITARHAWYNVRMPSKHLVHLPAKAGLPITKSYLKACSMKNIIHYFKRI